ncbi:MAG: substrate-binding domain-containing protein [Erysipelotrichaceae bacterium]|nr:substrate-binding domain-containing protein [Erysipelotrichaceae bacterium]
MKIFKKILLAILILFIVLLSGGWLFFHHMQTQKEKYMGHGFEYMHGYSSTDFTGYHVYDDEKLFHLDHEASLRINEEENMPVLDGAEACYPLYAAIAKAVYKDIGDIETDALKQAEASRDQKPAVYDKEKMDVLFNNGKIVTFTNTLQGYERLTNREVDLFFGARPSAHQREMASDKHEQILSMPIGKEAFVFFTEKDNPVDGLSSEQLRAIYHGDIVNWKEVGGKNEKIVAFQRPEDSGSQAMMKWFMGDVSLKEPKTFEYIGGMGDVIKKVAQYHNEKGAIGYTFRYFLTQLQAEQDVKILSIDGIEPSDENIADGSYPATVPLVCAYLVSNEDPYVRQMISFLLSDDGQKIIEGTGYVPLSDRSVTPFIENEVESRIPEVYTCDNWTLNIYAGKDNEEDKDFELFNPDRYFKGYVFNYGMNDEEWLKEYGHYSLVPYDQSVEIFFDVREEGLLVKKVEELEGGKFPPEAGDLFVKVLE